MYATWCLNGDATNDTNMSATLTRHFYALDEVVAALQLCLRFRRNDETPFWLWELVRSDETALAHTTLRQTWLDFGGGWFAPTMLSATPPSDTDAWLQLLSTVTQAIELADSASSVPLMLRTAVTQKRPAVTPLAGLCAADSRTFIATLDPAEGMTPDQAGMWFSALRAAIRAAKTLDAAWLLQAAAPILSADAVWAALHLLDSDGHHKRIQDLLRKVATAHPVSQTQHQITAALLLMGPPEMCDAPSRPCSFSWSDYDAKLGRRAARRFLIPPMALHTGTTRGQLSSNESNLDQLSDPVPYFPEACAYWRAVIQTAPGVELEEDSVIFTDAVATEQFYATHFPDKIPEEWSAEDQQKSHGAGCAETAPAPPPTPPVREESLTVEALGAALIIRVRAIDGTKKLTLRHD